MLVHEATAAQAHDRHATEDSERPPGKRVREGADRRELIGDRVAATRIHVAPGNSFAIRLVCGGRIRAAAQDDRMSLSVYVLKVLARRVLLPEVRMAHDLVHHPV